MNEILYLDFDIKLIFPVGGQTYLFRFRDPFPLSTKSNSRLVYRSVQKNQHYYLNNKAFRNFIPSSAATQR